MFSTVSIYKSQEAKTCSKLLCGKDGRTVRNDQCQNLMLQGMNKYWLYVNWKKKPNRTVPNRFGVFQMRYLRTLHIIWSLMSRRVTRRLTRLQTITTFLNIAKHCKIMTKIKFTGTATEPHWNRKLCNFKNAQYCKRPTSLRFNPSQSRQIV